MPLLTTIARLAPLGVAMVAGGLLVLHAPFIGILLISVLIPAENLLRIGIGELTYIWPLSIATLGAWFARLTVTGWRIRIARLPTLMLGLWVLWGTASFFWAADAGSVVWRIVLLAGFFALFLLFQNLIRSDGQLRTLLVGYFVASALFAVLALGVTLSSGLQRATLIAGQNPNIAARGLGIGLLLAPYVFRQTKRRWWKLLAILGSLALSLVVVLTGSRGAWIGLITAVGFVWAVSRARLFRARYVVIAAVVVSLGIAGLQRYGLLSDIVLVRIASVPSQGLEAGEGRFNIWTVGLEMVKAKPLLGVGLGNFPAVFEEYIDVSGLEGARAIYPGRDPHNILVSVQCELGTVGILVLLAFFAAILRSLLRCRSDPRAVVGLLLLAFMFFSGMTATIQYKKFFWFAMSVSALVPMVIRSESS